MPPTVHPHTSVALLTPAVEALAINVAALSDDQWQRPSNCAGWDVAKLCAHVTRNGESLLARVRSILANDDTPPPDRAAMDAHEVDMIAAGRPAMADNLRTTATGFRQLVESCTEQQLALVSADRSGRSMLAGRKLGWFANQRLSEVAFHHWDLRRSLGSGEPLEAGLARYLLAFMFPPGDRMGSGSAARSDAAPGTFQLVATDSGDVYRVRFGADGRFVEADPFGPAEVGVEAESGWLALAAYGRAPLLPPEFSVTGPRDAAQRFAGVFGSPSV